MAEPRHIEGQHVSPKQDFSITPGMGDSVVPYAGKAPTPQRTADFAPTGHQGYDPNLNGPGAASAGVNQAPSPPDTPGVVQTSTPPPEQPDMAAQLAEMNKKYGDVVRSLGEIKAAHARQLEETQFNAEIMNVPTSQAPLGAPVSAPLPQEINPEDSPSWAQIHAMNQNLVPLMQANATAHALRAIWDVTQQEEQQAYANYPALGQRVEPDRTRLIYRAVMLQRQRQGQASPPAGSPVPVQASGHVVPMVEGTDPAPNVTEPARPTTLADKARAEYESAERAVQEATTDMAKKAAMRVQSAAFDRLQNAMGRTQEMQKQEGFTQTL